MVDNGVFVPRAEMKNKMQIVSSSTEIFLDFSDVFVDNKNRIILYLSKCGFTYKEEDEHGCQHDFFFVANFGSSEG